MHRLSPIPYVFECALLLVDLQCATCAAMHARLPATKKFPGLKVSRYGLRTERRTKPLAKRGTPFRQGSVAACIAQTRPDRRRPRTVGLGHHQTRFENR